MTKNKKIYALKDINTNLYFNRVHKDFRELGQNTAFYKTKRNALQEIEHSIGSTLSNRYREYCKLEEVVFDYIELDKYCKLHKKEFNVVVTPVEIKEVEDVE